MGGEERERKELDDGCWRERFGRLECFEVEKLHICKNIGTKNYLVQQRFFRIIQIVIFVFRG